MTSHIALPESLQTGGGPLVSVVVPTYEDSEYLPAALESIAAQTHENLEIVIVDSSSVEWLSALAEGTVGVEYVYQDPSGLAAARNRGLDACTGEFIGFLDADDRWCPEKTEKQLRALRDGADVVYSDAYLVEGANRRRMYSLPVRNPDTHHVDFLLEGGVPMPTVVARADCFERERFNETLRAVEDRNMWARLFGQFEPARIAEPLACYTVRADSMSSDPEVMYESEQQNIADLAARFDDVNEYRAELEQRAVYAHGKRLLRAGRGREARTVFRRLLGAGRYDVRTLALFVLSQVPAGHRRLLVAMERGMERFRGFRQ